MIGNWRSYGKKELKTNAMRILERREKSLIHIRLMNAANLQTESM